MSLTWAFIQHQLHVNSLPFIRHSLVCYISESFIDMYLYLLFLVRILPSQLSHNSETNSVYPVMIPCTFFRNIVVFVASISLYGLISCMLYVFMLSASLFTFSSIIALEPHVSVPCKARSFGNKNRTALYCPDAQQWKSTEVQEVVVEA